jgi:hypothetical protein
VSIAEIPAADDTYIWSFLMKVKLSDVKRIIREEYARGMPEFTMARIASECAEDVKRQLVNYINQKSNNPQQQRRLLGIANSVTNELEIEIKSKIEEKLLEFFQNT